MSKLFCPTLYTRKHRVHTRVSGTHKEISTGTQVFSTIDMKQVNEIPLIETAMDVEVKTIGEQRKNLNLNNQTSYKVSFLLQNFRVFR